MIPAVLSGLLRVPGGVFMEVVSEGIWARLEEDWFEEEGLASPLQALEGDDKRGFHE
jgi:hypothetical protein